jgi:integrase/recombinase XerD
MSTLAEHTQNYLTIRRALGFKLVGEGQLLAEFVAFADTIGERTITTKFALEWARRPQDASANYLSRRLRAVRGFARYLHALDPACEIPPLELLPASKYRPAPYLYRDEEIVALMTAASMLHPPLRAATFRTLIGLLACSGLRIGEAIRLDREDLDATHGLFDGPRFEVRQVKGGAAAPQHHAGAGRVRQDPRPDLPAADAAKLLHHYPRHEALPPNDL